MKRFRFLIAAAAALVLLTGCDPNGGNVFDDPFGTEKTSSSEADSSVESVDDISDEESRAEIEKKVKDQKLSSSLEYYLSSQPENFTTACKALVKGAKAFEKDIDLRGLNLNKEDLSELILLVISTEPELLMVDPAYAYSSDKNNCITEVTFKYTLSEKEHKKAMDKLSAAAEEITAKTAGRSDFDKLLCFHDAIISGCTYSDSSSYPYSAYSCLVEGKAVCEGYSKAFGLLCDMVGIECIPVLGKANDGDTESHMWNKVCIDGEWYNMDITWDDPVSNMDKDYMSYSYFGVTDDEIKSDHTPEPTRLLKYPKASGTKYNYFSATNQSIEDASDADSILLAAITSQALAGLKYVQFRCKDKATFDKVFDREFSDKNGNPHIFGILSSAASASGGAFSPDSYSITKNEKMLTFTVILDM